MLPRLWNRAFGGCETGGGGCRLCRARRESSDYGEEIGGYGGDAGGVARGDGSGVGPAGGRGDRLPLPGISASRLLSLAERRDDERNLLRQERGRGPRFLRRRPEARRSGRVGDRRGIPGA